MPYSANWKVQFYYLEGDNMTLRVHIFQDSISQVYDKLSEGAIELITQDVCDLDDDMYKSDDDILESGTEPVPASDHF